MESLEARVGRLEKSARRWRVAAMSLIVGGIGAMSMGQITLGGGSGGIQAPLITADNYVVNKALTFNDSNGKGRVVISVENDKPVIEMKDGEEHTLVSITGTEKGGSFLIQD